MTRGIQKALGFTLWLVCSGAAIWYYFQFADQIPRLTYLSGWILLALMLILTAYNWIKKIPFLPIGTSRGWMQVHIYIGLLAAVLFGIHLRGRIPTGPFEQVLAAFFILVTLSGIAGLFLSRSLPKRLTTTGGEVPFHRIHIIRRDLREQARALAFATVSASQSVIIPDYFTRRLEPFFAKPRNFWLHLMEVRRPLNTLLKEIGELDRYAGSDDKGTLQRLGQLVRQKDVLDYHYALQSVLKAWLFIHIPFTYGLLLLVVLHVVLVYSFSGGVR